MTKRLQALANGASSWWLINRRYYKHIQFQTFMWFGSYHFILLQTSIIFCMREAGRISIQFQTYSCLYLFYPFFSLIHIKTVIYQSNDYQGGRQVQCMKKYRNRSPAEMLIALSAPYQLLPCPYPARCESQPELLGKIGQEKGNQREKACRFESNSPI